MKLWIANTTKQNHDFVYRPRVGTGGQTAEGFLKPVFGEIRKQHIPLGGQICVGDLKEDEISTILDQHKHIVDFKDLNKVRGFQGLCYRQGENPVPIGEILERLETNDKARSDENTVRQTTTALEIAANMRNVAQQTDAPFKDLRETDVQVAQKGDQEVNNNTPQINQVVEVTEEGKQPSGRGRKSAA